MESKTLVVTGSAICVGGLIAVLLPFAFHPTEHRTSVLFLAVPPLGNNTFSANILISNMKTDIIAMQMNGDLWAHFVCVLAALEAALLFMKFCAISSEDDLNSEKEILRHGGMYTAEMEFWLFVFIHHTILVLVVNSPVSVHALLLMVFVYVRFISYLCEATKDTCQDDFIDNFTEKKAIRVMIVVVYGLMTCILITIDQRMNMATVSSNGLQSIALFAQFFFDVLLMMIHAPADTTLVLSCLSRIIYTFACAGTMILWLCS
jgi:hypothetical protein